MNFRICLTSLLAGLALLATPLVAQDDKTEWGDLTATFLYEGEPPKPKELILGGAVPAFKVPLFDQSLLVEPKTKGIANVVVWLYVAPQTKLPPIHPSYAELPKRDVTLSCLNGEFDPHISLITTDQTFVLNNPDKVGYNVKGDFFKNGSFNNLIPAGGSSPRVFSKQEAAPMPIACGIHSWMSGYILAKDHPYFAKSNSEGKLQIKNLPVGTHTFSLWHERRGFIANGKLNGKQTKWNRGRFTVDIKPGDNDLGKIELVLD
jgi:hypothetical protein